MLFSTYGPFLSGVLFVLSGLSVIALGELFIAVRENTLNNRMALLEERRFSHYDYGGLHVVGWINVVVGFLLVLLGVFQVFSPLFR